MKPNQAAATIAFAATLLAAGSAFAAAGPTNAEYYPFQESTSVRVIDNATMVKSTAKSDDAKTMGAQGQSSSHDRAREIEMYQKAGS